MRGKSELIGGTRGSGTMSCEVSCRGYSSVDSSHG
jgi:hypothetical protein